MNAIKTYNEIAIDIAQLQQRIWTDLQDRCHVVMNQLELKVVKGKVKPCRELTVCKSIWKDYQATPATLRARPSTEWTSELTVMLELCNEIPNFYARAVK